jgi:uncharacterized repeat protein (TIGR03803 family)
MAEITSAKQFAFSPARSRKLSVVLNRASLAFVFIICVVATTAVFGQTFETVTTFSGSAQSPDFGPLVQGTNGHLYGTVGFNTDGSVFQINGAGTLTTVHSFDGTDGEYPFAGLMLAANGNFYGTTEDGGANSSGTLFELTPAGNLTTLYNFCALTTCVDGGNPAANLVQKGDGNFYGTTLVGGTSFGGLNGCAELDGAIGCGTVFTITPAGKLTTLYNFCSKPKCADGEFPQSTLVRTEIDGTLYGSTFSGGSTPKCTGCGVVYEITAAGHFSVLYKFCQLAGCADGSAPSGLLLSNGNLYGTTQGGGANGKGTVFELSLGGTLRTLYSFCSQANCADGASPEAALIRTNDGNFYGTTLLGGTNNKGTIFKITPAGELTTLHSFCFASDCGGGNFPQAPLMQDTNGKLYGTTMNGGTNDEGIVFSLSLGLPPFVKAIPAYGATGTKVNILGNNLTGASTVNGTAATFKVVNSAWIIATVPTDATTGTVAVTLPARTLNSNNVQFQVVP